MKRLPRSFYSRNTITVAQELLGKIFIRRIGRTVLSGMIVETEAYLFDDPASHSFRGITERNKVMFGPPGHLYVYFTYGMHYCANIVTRSEGIGEAVLIRAVEPIDGVQKMTLLRSVKRSVPFLQLTNGPAKFAQAFGITTAHSGSDLTKGTIIIAEEEHRSRPAFTTATRIGISTAVEEPLRFYCTGNRWVSRT